MRRKAERAAADAKRAELEAGWRANPDTRPLDTLEMTERLRWRIRQYPCFECGPLTVGDLRALDMNGFLGQRGVGAALHGDLVVLCEPLGIAVPAFDKQAHVKANAKASRERREARIAEKAIAKYKREHDR